MDTHERYWFIVLSYCTVLSGLGIDAVLLFKKQLGKFPFISNAWEQFKKHRDYLDGEGLEEFPCQTIWPLCYSLVWFLNVFAYLFHVNWTI